MGAMTTEPEVSELPARPYAAIPASVTMDTIGTVVPPLNGEVFMARSLEVEAGCPVAGPVTGDERVVADVLPAGRYATLSHVGHPSTLVAATAALLDWAAAKDLKWDMVPSASGERWGARLEIYLTDPKNEPDMTKWVTELAFRLAD